MCRQYGQLAMVQREVDVLAMRVQEPHPHPSLPGSWQASLRSRADEPDGRVVVASCPMRLPHIHKHSNRDLRSNAAEAGASAQRHTKKERPAGDGTGYVPCHHRRPQVWQESARVGQRLLPLPAHRACPSSAVTNAARRSLLCLWEGGSRRLFGVERAGVWIKVGCKPHQE